MNQPISSPLPTDRHISPSAQTVVRPVAEHVASDHRDTGTLGKALTVLSVIAQSPHPMRFTDLLKQVDQPRGTLHRHLSNLVDEGLLRLNHDHTYEPGLRLLTLAANAWSKNSFRVVAEPHMRNLQRQTGETVHLGALNGLEVVYLDKLESRDAQIQEAYRAILIRDAAPEELDLMQSFLSARQDRPQESIRQMVWALLTSAEARFNH